jgi:RNA recognition motif-containing protein
MKQARKPKNPPTVPNPDKPKRKSKNAGINQPSDRKVFVSGLSFEASKTTVLEAFSAYGAISGLHLVTFPDSGRCNGQAFVDFEDAAAARKAMEGMDGEELGGRRLKVGPVKSRAVTQKRKGGAQGGAQGGGKGKRTKQAVAAE